MLASLGFSWLAGVLSTLSPCVLPILPIVVGAAASAHRLGPVALAAGLSLSFTAIGLFVATIGQAIGLDGEVFRLVSAAMLGAFGLVLLSTSLQMRLATALGPVSALAEQRLTAIGGDSLSGQFVIGLLLGAVWSPCVGPTLGSASLMAAQGESLGQAGVMMALFGLGAATPLGLLALASKDRVRALKAKLMTAGSAGKVVLGVLLLAVALAVATGLDKRLEAAVLTIAPEWLITLTTTF
ncbi:MAG: cytochrome c biogenesis protein CcdA [Alphaproteobacteria bacterium]|nr:cytochrome c biogenesis protein CcdA [Alphaproteobacteria bacterium]TAD89334.1 MAG: cytochrome c biogenesis protein CcdA [Alphaproteobacteria bacterium]